MPHPHETLATVERSLDPHAHHNQDGILLAQPKATPSPARKDNPMADRLITLSFTTLYGQKECDPLSLDHHTGNHHGNIDTDKVRRLYHAQVEQAIHLIRPNWILTLDGAVYTHHPLRHISLKESEELHDLIDMIDLDAIIAAATR